MNGVHITNIQRFSLDDGPGIRTTVFFKGCSLSCLWCHNPECIAPFPQLEYDAARCALCGACAAVCTNHVHTVSVEHELSRDRCVRCGACVAACPEKALSIRGRAFSVEDILAEIGKDKPFYKRSGGGATFSGGEPMLYPAELTQLLQGCREQGIHTAVDTAGNVPWTHFEQILPLADLFLYDIKIMDRAAHRRFTGADNDRIHDNLRRLAASGARIFIRIPVIPGVNDSHGEMTAMADFLTDIQPERIQLLPYHNYGLGKERLLGFDNRLGADCALAPDFLPGILPLFLERELPASIK